MRPSNHFFHLERPEVKARIKAARRLIFLINAIVLLMFFKFGIQVYEVVEHVSSKANDGTGVVDYLLIKVILVLLSKMLYTGVAFKADGK